ncbi:MAG TPA: hypothetical protein VFB22_03460 [Candidatus Baltobacteraceae bacterium]|nr:hypothetical protein [Candidatus Baltobacteraceae bacterium]
MLSFQRPLLGVLAVALSASLAACGGGGSSAPAAPVTGPTSTPTSVPPSGAGITAYPSTLTFAGAGSAAQAFTVQLTGQNTATPKLSTQCGSVASVTTTSTTFPATYTVTPLATGGCTVVFTAGNSSAAVSITVGASGGGALSSSNTTLTLATGASGTFTVTATSGTIGADATACSGIANVTPAAGGTATSQTYNVSTIAAGTCAVTVYDGAFVFQETIVVSGATPKNAVTLSPPALTFSSPTAPAQQVQVSFTGSVGAVSIDESSCYSTASNGPKIAYLTLVGTSAGTSVSLPVTASVQPFGSGYPGGTCQIVFTPQTGAAATLQVTVAP